MHVCVVFGLTLVPPGGAERLCIEEATHFAGDHDVTVFAPEYDAGYVAETLPDSVETVEYGRPHKGWRGVRRLRPLLAERDPDLVLSHYATEEVSVCCALDGTPYAPHVHGSVLWFPDDPRLVPHVGTPAYERLVAEVPGHRTFHDPPALSARQRLWATVGERVRGRGLRNAAAVFTGSQRVAHELDGLYDADSTVVRPGIDAAWLDGHDPRDLSEHEHDLLSVSRLDPRKRIETQIRAVAQLAERSYDVGLTVCGTGPDEDRLREAVDDAGIGNRVTFAGYVADDALPSYYAGADAFGCSAWMSYGLSPLEAYGVGTPVVLSTDTYAKEILASKPATSVADPNPESWADAVATRLDSDETPNRDTVPTWTEFCREKERRLGERGLLT